MAINPQTTINSGVWWEAARPRTLPAAVAPVVVGTALAIHARQFDGLAAAACLGFALLIQVAANFANDYYDFVNGADTAARVGPRRAVAAGLISPARMRRAMFAALAAAFLLGTTLVYWGGPWLLLVGAASVVCAVAYTGGPYPLGYHGFGDLLVFVFFGPVAVLGTFYVQADRIALDAALASVPIGLLAANILLVNNYRDADTDRAAGKRTLVVRWGRPAARAQFDGALAVAFAMPLLLWWRGFSPLVLLVLLELPVALRHRRRLREAANPPELIALLASTGKLLGIYALLLGVGLAIR